MSRNTGKDNKGIVSLLLGIGVAMLICVMLIMGMAQLLLAQKLGQGSSEIFIVAILLLSAFLGNCVSAKLSQKQILPVCMITTAAIAGTMLMGGLALDGQFRNVLLRLGAVMAGGVISCMLCLKNPSKATRKKKRYR